MQSPERLALPVDDFNVNRSLKNRVRKRLNGECLYCGQSSLFLTVDHIIPVCMGGTTTESNLAPCCLDCNRSKSHRPVLDWWIEQTFYSADRVKLLYDLLYTDNRS